MKAYIIFLLFQTVKTYASESRLEKRVKGKTGTIELVYEIDKSEPNGTYRIMNASSNEVVGRKIQKDDSSKNLTGQFLIEDAKEEDFILKNEFGKVIKSSQTQNTKTKVTPKDANSSPANSKYPEIEVSE